MRQLLHETLIKPRRNGLTQDDSKESEGSRDQDAHCLPGRYGSKFPWRSSVAALVTRSSDLPPRSRQLSLIHIHSYGINQERRSPQVKIICRNCGHRLRRPNNKCPQCGHSMTTRQQREVAIWFVFGLVVCV